MSDSNERYHSLNMTNRNSTTKHHSQRMVGCCGNFVMGFKKFLSRGNIIDLAIGLVIGAAFTKIVNSVVDDIFSPVIGLALKRVNLDSMFVIIQKGNDSSVIAYNTIDQAKAFGAVTINYGRLLQAIVAFFVTGFAVYIFAQTIDLLRFRKNDEGKITKECPFCFENIPIKAIRCSRCTSYLNGQDIERRSKCGEIPILS